MKAKTIETLRSVNAGQDQRIVSLEAEVVRLTVALEKIARKENWGLSKNPTWYGRSHPLKIAREALGSDLDEVIVLED